MPYKVNVKCQNCGEALYDLEIPLGQRVEDTPCPRCKCRTLVRMR